MNIVFDFGEVLFTWEPAVLLARQFPQLTQSPEQARKLAVEVFHHEDWQNFDRGLMELDDVVTRTAARLELDSGAMRGLMEPIGERLEPIACNVAVLKELSERRSDAGDVRLYFLSNMPVPFARALERKHAFLQCFDGGVFSGDAKLAKPDPEIYRLLQTRYALDPATTLFIDDALVNVQAAQALGWKAIHCERPETLPGAVGAFLRSYVPSSGSVHVPTT